jgi:hypothetical protein
VPRRPANPQAFEGFDSPNTTAIPDQFLDWVMQDLSLNELRIMLYIMRRTFGFKKQRDAIALQQFVDGIVTRQGKRLDRGCGVRGRGHLMEALRALEEKGYIISEPQPEGLPTVYRLRLRGDPVRHLQESAGVPNGITADPNGIMRGSYADPPGVPNGHLQKTEDQATAQHPGQQTGRDPAALWEAVLREVAAIVTRPVYETYLAESQAIGLRGATLLVAVRDAQAGAYVAQKLSRLLVPALKRVAGEAAELEVC